MAPVQSEGSDTDPTIQVMSRNGQANGNSNAPAETNDVCRLEAGSEKETAGSSAVPDGSWGWIVVIGAFMIHLIVDGFLYSFGVFVEDFVDYFECSKSAVGGLGSVMLGAARCSGDE